MTQDNQKSIFEEPNPGVLVSALIFSKKWIILSISTLLTIGVAIYLFNFADVYFKSSINAVPPKQSNPLADAAGGIGGALREFGLTKLAGKSGDSYDFIVLLESRTILDSLISKYELPKVYDIPDSLQEKVRNALQSNLSIEVNKEGNYIIEVWDTDKFRAANMANDFIYFANNLAKDIFLRETKDNLEYMERKMYSVDSTLAAISDSLKFYSRDKRIFSVKDQAQAISKTLAEIKSQEVLADINYNIFKNIYGDNDPTTQMSKRLSDEAKLKIEEMETQSGVFGNFSLDEAPEIAVHYLHLFAEFETYQKVKAFMLPMVENTRVDLQRNLKGLYVIDAAVPAEKKDKPKRSVLIAGTFVGSIFLLTFLVVLFHNISQFFSKVKKVTNT